MASHDEVAEKFGKRQINSRSKRVEWSASRVYCSNDLIFSYGGHFPMAKYLGEHPKKKIHFFIKNHDGYSSSTSAHQSCVRAHCPGPSVSRSRLSKYIDFTSLTMDNIHLWRPGQYRHMWQDSETGLFYDDAEYRTLEPTDAEPTDPFMSLDDEPDLEDPKKVFQVVNLQRHVYVFAKPVKPSRFGKFKAYRKQDSKRFKQGMFTVQEILVLKVKNKYLLCIPGNIVELDGQPRTISEAFKMGQKALN